VNTRKPPLESRITKKILDALRKRGGFWQKTHGSPLVTRGLPDIIGVYRGRYIAFEVKRDASGKLSELQAFKFKEIREAGGKASRIWTVEQALSVLDRIDELQEARARRRNSTSQ